MGHIMLREAVTRPVTVHKEVKPALHARVCDVCGTVFQMRPLLRGTSAGVVQGSFDRTKAPFEADVCSLGCATDLFERGFWRDIPRYAPQVEAGESLVAVAVTVTSFVRGRSEIEAAWAAEPETDDSSPAGAEPEPEGS